MVELSGRRSPECSALRVRRFAAGELSGVEQERAREHVAGCSRCQEALREIEDERARLARDVPFEVFAAGVAEKLARPSPRRSWSRLVPLAAAAAALLVVVGTRMAKDEPGTRTKGGATLALFQQDGPTAIALGPEGKTGTGPIAAQVAGGRYAAVLLQEPGETSLLYSGEAKLSVQHPFEWTGAARRATVLVVVSDRPLDGEAVRAAIAGQGPAGAPKGTEVVMRPLERSGP